MALVLSALAMGVAGCAPEAAEPESQQDESALQAPSSQATLPNPDGTFFANVTANGTGCPAGSWVTNISPDGQTFTTTFSQYEASLDPSKVVDVKDCNLSIKLHSPQGLSYSVTNFYYAGYAFLEEGLTGRQEASYYFQGNPTPQTQVRTNLVGPYDQSYLFSDQVPITDVVWSPCGLDRDLNVVTRVRLLNNTAKRGAGYMNLSSIDGAVSKLVLQLNWRSCTAAAAGADAGVKDAGSKDAGSADAGRDAGRTGRR